VLAGLLLFHSSTAGYRLTADCGFTGERPPALRVQGTILCRDDHIVEVRDRCRDRERKIKDEVVGVEDAEKVEMGRERERRERGAESSSEERAFPLAGLWSS
jgi:hypothetical protein